MTDTSELNLKHFGKQALKSVLSDCNAQSELKSPELQCMVVVLNYGPAAARVSTWGLVRNERF